MQKFNKFANNGLRTAITCKTRDLPSLFALKEKKQLQTQNGQNTFCKEKRKTVFIYPLLHHYGSLTSRFSAVILKFGSFNSCESHVFPNLIKHLVSDS